MKKLIEKRRNLADDLKQRHIILLNDAYYKALLKLKGRVYEASPIQTIVVNGVCTEIIYPERTLKLIGNIDMQIEQRIQQLTS